MSPDRRARREPTSSASDTAKRARPRPGLYPTAQGHVEIRQDPDDANSWLVLIDGVPSSSVDLSDPTHLDFEYMVWMGAVLDATAAAGAPLSVVHAGGAGCTLASYVAATRPGSRQVVFENDAALLELTREMFGLRSSKQLRLRAQDAYVGVHELPEGHVDVVIRDAFADAKVPAALAGEPFVAAVRRALTDDGIYLANVADGPPLTSARSEVATIATQFTDIAVLTEPAVIRGRRRGNLVVIASNGRLPLDALRRRASAGAVPARLVEGERVRDFVAGAPVLSSQPAAGTSA